MQVLDLNIFTRNNFFRVRSIASVFVLFVMLFLSIGQPVYGEAGQDFQEGTLWVDRKGARFVLTLGSEQGVRKGTRLSVYESDRKVGNVTVDKALKTVSYVYPVKEALSFFNKSYYRVVMEKTSSAFARDHEFIREGR